MRLPERILFVGTAGVFASAPQFALLAVHAPVVLIAASTLVALLINFVGLNPVAALFWVSVINGFLSPPLLVLVMLIANNPKVVGEQVNGPVLNVAGWSTTALMFAAAVGLVATWAK